LLWTNVLSLITDRFVNNLVRFMVVLSKKSGNTFPSMSDVINSEDQTGEYRSFGALPDMERGDEFTVLLDKVLFNNCNVRLIGADRNDYVSNHEYIIDLGGVVCTPYGPGPLDNGYNKIFMFIKKSYITSAGISAQGVTLDGGSSCARLYFTDV